MRRLEITATESGCGGWANYCLVIDGKRTAWATAPPSLGTESVFKLVSYIASQVSLTLEEGIEVVKLAMNAKVVPLHATAATPTDLPAPQA